MKTFIANETLLLIEGDIMIVETSCKKGDTLIDTHSNTIYKANTDSDCLVKYIYKIVASTKQLPNVKQLPREVFVKGVDVDDLAISTIRNCFSSHIECFKKGFYANKGIYTEIEMNIAICRASILARKGEVNVQSVIDGLRPLTLPKSITTNDELEIIEIIW